MNARTNAKKPATRRQREQIARMRRELEELTDEIQRGCAETLALIASMRETARRIDSRRNGGGVR